MFKLNNKGQSLVMFVIIIPIFMLVFTLVYDVGTAIYEKNRLSNTSYMVVDYALDNINSINENEMIDLIQKNINNLNYIFVDVNSDRIEVVLSKNIKGIIGRMFGFNLIEANSHYEGSLVNDEKIIERIKWYYGR